MIIAPNARRFADALSSAPPGESISLNAGKYVAPPGGFVVGKGVRIGGTHPLRNRIEGGTIIVPASPNDHAFQVVGQNARLSDLIVRGSERPGDGDGIHLTQTGTAACLELERLMIWGVGRDGIHIEPKEGSVNLLEIRSCISNKNGRHGLYVSTSFGIAVTGGYYAGNGRCGVMLDGCDSAALWHVAAEGNQRSGPASDLEPQIFLRGVAGGNFDGCVIEDFARWSGGQCALTLENNVGTRIVGCTFTNPTSVPSRGIVFRRCRSCLVDLNTWVRVSRPFDLDATSKDVITRPQAVRVAAD